MKTIWSLIIFISFSFLMFSGISLISSQAVINGNVDAESLQVMALYDPLVEDFNNNFTSVQNQTAGIADFQPNNNLVDEFVKEYSEHVSRIDQLRNGIKLVYKIPDLMLLSIPFIEYDDLGIYRDVLWFLVSILLIIIIIRALSQKQVTED